MKRSFTTLLLLILCFQGVAQTETSDPASESTVIARSRSCEGTEAGATWQRHPESGILNQWSFSVTPIYLQSREEILFGSRFGSFGIIVKPEWERRSERFIQSASLTVGYSQPKMRMEPVRASVQVDAALSNSFEYIVCNGKAGMFSVGGKGKADYTLEYLPVLDDSHLFWTSFIGIGPQVRWEKAVRAKNHLYAKLDFPLAGFLSRPPAYWNYKAINSSIGNILSTINSNFQFAFINSYFNPSLELGYKVKQSDSFTIGFHYMIDYLYAKTSSSNPYFQLINGIGLQFIF